MHVFNPIILVPDTVKGAVGVTEEKGQGPDTYCASKVCLLIPFDLYQLTTSNTYIRKQEKTKTSELKYPTPQVRKISPKGNKRKKLVKTKAEINVCVCVLKLHRETNNRSKSWILEKINKPKNKNKN